MITLRSLAIAATVVGSTSLAMAQGPGIAPSGAVLPPHTNLQGLSQGPTSGPSVQTKKTHHRLYMSAAKKKRHTTSK